VCLPSLITSLPLVRHWSRLLHGPSKLLALLFSVSAPKRNHTTHTACLLYCMCAAASDVSTTKALVHCRVHECCIASDVTLLLTLQNGFTSLCSLLAACTTGASTGDDSTIATAGTAVGTVAGVSYTFPGSTQVSGNMYCFYMNFCRNRHVLVFQEISPGSSSEPS
jgi:hypothetical protein